MVKLNSAVAALAIATPFATAQTYSACDPTKKTDCPPNSGLNSAEYNIDFSKGQTADWTATSGAATYGVDGAKFSIKQLGDGPTIQSNFYMFYGYVEVKMKAAPGQGIVSSFVMESDNLDEIDWEMIGSENTKVQSNYFGKGNTTTYDRGAYHPVTTPTETFSTYAVNWTKESTTWLINGSPVRTVNYADAVGGKNYPQTPMNIRLGNWVAGDPKNQPGTIQWAGGLADMKQGPFEMVVQSLKIINYNPAASYTYGDQSGSSDSIKMGTEKVSAAAPAPSASGESGAGVGAKGPGSTVTVRPQGNGVSTSCTKGTKATSAAKGESGSRSGSNSNSRGLAKPSNTKSLGGEVAGIAKTVTINPQGFATGRPSSNSSSPAGSSGSSGSSESESGSSGSSGSGGILVAQGAPMNQTASTISIGLGGSAASATPAAQSAGSASTLMSFGLDGSSTSSSRPAQVTTNAASRVVGSTGALALVLGMVVLFL